MIHSAESVLRRHEMWTEHNGWQQFEQVL